MAKKIKPAKKAASKNKKVTKKAVTRSASPKRKKATVKKAAPKKVVAKKKTVVKKKTVKKAIAKPASRKGKKPAAKKVAVKKASPKKAVARKVTVKKAAVKKVVTAKVAPRPAAPVVKKAVLVTMPKPEAVPLPPVEEQSAEDLAAKAANIDTGISQVTPGDRLNDAPLITEDPVRTFDQNEFNKGTLKGELHSNLRFNSKPKNAVKPSGKKPLWNK